MLQNKDTAKTAKKGQINPTTADVNLHFNGNQNTVYLDVEGDSGGNVDTEERLFEKEGYEDEGFFFKKCKNFFTI